MAETFWSADTPSRTRLRRKRKIVHTFPPPLRQPALCSASPNSLYCAAAGPPAVRAQPNGGEDDDKEAISSAATILTVCCCGYQWWTCYCCFHCYLEFRKYLVADKLQRNRSIVPPAMFLCICTMLYVVICFCRLLLLYSRIPRPPLAWGDPSAVYCALNGSPNSRNDATAPRHVWLRPDMI